MQWQEWTKDGKPKHDDYGDRLAKDEMKDFCAIFALCLVGFFLGLVLVYMPSELIDVTLDRLCGPKP